MSLVLIIVAVYTNKIIYINSNSVESIEMVLENKLGSDYAMMYDYTYINVFNGALIVPKYFDKNSKSVPEFEGSTLDILQQSIDYVNTISYSRNESDPNVSLKTGVGNCQSMSLILDSLLSKYDLNSSIIIDDNHMFNKVTLDDVVYLVDLAGGSIEMEVNDESSEN